MNLRMELGVGFMRELGIMGMKYFNDWCVDYLELTMI